MARRTGKADADWPDFIIDAPAEADSLNAHDRVATAIAEVIVRRPKVKMIGLLGGWGSGKSTVVGLVKKRLAGLSDHAPLYYVYDTWLRQSDPPRRAFLEGLVGFLEDTDIPQVHKASKGWRTSLRELDGTSKTTVTATKVELTKAGLFILPTLVFVPLGNRLVGDTSKALVALGWLMSVGPALMAVFLLVAMKMSLREVLAVVTNRGGDAKHEVRTQSPEPTAIEFQQRFEAITRTLRGAGRQLVIVVDNLDRLPPAEAVTLWSTLRSFFLEAEEGRAGIARKDLPVILVPLDPSAPGRIHGEREAEGKGHLSQSFVEKTFDVVFHVPPPVLSSWQDYLRRRLRDVFGARMPSEWPDTVATVYECLQRDETLDLSTTPRSLNSFANAMGVLWAQWRSDPAMTPAAMAYFICRRTEIEAGLRLALEKKTFSIEADDPDWQASVATLYFGVPRSRARELYLGDPIRAAIAAVDEKTFRELAKSPSFDRYLDQVLSGVTPPSPFSMARTLGKAALPEAAWLKPIWRKLRAAAGGTVGHGPLKDGDAEAVAILAQTAEEPERSQWLMGLAGFAKHTPSENLLADDGAPAAAFFAAIAQTAREHGLTDLRVRMPDDARVYIAMLAIGGMAEDLAALEPLQSPDAVLLLLCEQIKVAPQAEKAEAAAASLAKVVSDQIDWAPMIAAIRAVFQEGEPTNVVIAFRFLADTWVFASAVRVAAMEFGRDNLLQAAWSRLPPDLSDLDLAMAVSVCLAASVSVAPNDGTGWDTMIGRRPDLPILVEGFLGVLNSEADLRRLRRTALDFPNFAPLMRAVAVVRVRGQESDHIDPYLLEDLPTYFQLLSQASLHSFWVVASRRLPEFWDALAQVEPERAAPIYAAIATTDDDRSAVDTALGKRLVGLGSDVWDAALDHAAQPWGLMRDIASSGVAPIALDPIVAERLMARIGPMMSNSDVQSRERWFAVLQWLDPSLRRKVLLSLRDALAETDAVDFTTFLNFGGPIFLGEEGWGAPPYERAGALVPRMLNMPGGVAWLEEHAEVVAGWIRRAPPEYRRAAVDGVRGTHNVQGGVVLKRLFALIEGL